MINQDFKSIPELLKAFQDEESCIKYLEDLRWPEEVNSPFDGTSKVYKCKGNKYKCRKTGKYFNVKTGTLFDNTKIDLQRWFLAIWMVSSHKKGISSMQLARDIKVTQKTAWFMLQRIRNCMAADNGGELNGEVEVDETYVGGKNRNRHVKKKVKGNSGRSSTDKTPVVGMVERSGRLIAKTINDVSSRTLSSSISNNIKKGSIVYTDEWRGYSQIKKNYNHEMVNHGRCQYVDGKAHTNTIEGFWSLLKRGIVGIYHSTSRKHLQRYIDEFVFRYNNRAMDENIRFNLVLINNTNRLTYKELIRCKATERKLENETAKLGEKILAEIRSLNLIWPSDRL